MGCHIVTVSREIKLITIKNSPMRTTAQIKQSRISIMQLYCRAGFTVQTILVDGQFEPMKNVLSNVVMNATTSSKHVGCLEQCLQVIKECVQFYNVWVVLPSSTKNNAHRAAGLCSNVIKCIPCKKWDIGAHHPKRKLFNNILISQNNERCSLEATAKYLMTP